MNYLLELGDLRNRYFVMRHGHSLANQRGIIVSDPANGVTEFGLSDAGRSQVEQRRISVERLDSATRILSSDFRRALETAEILHRRLSCDPPLITDPRLRERHFGRLELGADTAYPDVWRHDEHDPDSRPHGAESANQVMARVTSLICEIEQRHRRETFLLVSHGDALQILLTAFARRSAAEHRRLPHLETAELRPIEASANLRNC